MGGKVETLTPHISKIGGPRGSKFFVQLALKNNILASGPPVKGAQERIISISKNFSETSQIFSILGVIPLQNMEGI